jgi:hypothetical protein
MFKILQFIKNQVLLNQRLNEEGEQQKKEGYKIDFVQQGPERYITYCEGKKEVTVEASFNFWNDVRLYKQSFVKWDKPRGEELTPFDYQKILNRLVRYFSCWGGEVILDDSDLQIQDLNEIKAELEKDGIEYQEMDGVIVYQSTVEEERKRKNSFLNKQ